MKQVSEADSGKSSAWKVTVLSREEQYDLKRKVLIQEAARAFSTRGYHATSLADVARELGVTKGALYYYVKSKQDILFECHVNSIALGDRAIEHARSIDGSGLAGSLPSICGRRASNWSSGRIGSSACVAS